MPVAVLLNANARQVSERIHKKIAAIVPGRDIFFTRTAGEADKAAHVMMDRGYKTVFSGGGDGTMVGLINRFRTLVRGADGVEHPEKLPNFGVLKLGTGNGLAVDTGVRAGFEKMMQVAAGDAFPVRTMRMINYEGHLTTWAGSGWDAAVLNDFSNLKESYVNDHMRKLGGGLGGYLFAAFAKTVPHEYGLQGKVEAEVINREDVSYPDPDTGRPVEIRDGEVIYRGKVNVAGVSVTPHYGFGLKVYPFAGLHPELMNLRIVAASIPAVVARLPKLWNGTLRHPLIIDRLVKKVDILHNMQRPFQLGGDAAGFKQNLHFEMSDFEVRLLNFTGTW